MKIDRLERSRHVSGRVLVFLEDGSLVKVTEQELLDFGLRAGDELDGDTLERLRDAASGSDAKARAAALIGRRAMSRRDLERKLTLEENVQAPVSAGQELGSVELSRNGTVYVSVPLVALNDVEASKLLTFWFNVREFFGRTSVRVALIVIGLLILAGVVWKLTMGRRRYRYGRPARRTRGYRGRRR